MRQWGLSMKKLNGTSLLAVAGAVALVVGTAACGGGGTSSSSTSSSSVGGVAADGLLSGANVTAYDSNDVSCATAKTAADGSYSIKIPTTCIPARIAVTGGTDQMTNATSDIELTTLVTDTTQTEANASPQTTLMTYAMLDAAGGAMSGLKSKTAQELSSLLTAAASNVLAEYGFGADADSTYNPMTTKLSNMSTVNYQAVLRASEATGETFRRMLSSTGNGNVSTANLKSLMQNFGRDLSDGALDGTATTTNLAAVTIGSGVNTYDMSALRTFSNTQAATVAGEVLNGSLIRNVIQSAGGGFDATKQKTVSDANLTAMFGRTGNATLTAIAPNQANIPVPTRFIQQAQNHSAAAEAAVVALSGAGVAGQFTALKNIFSGLTAGAVPGALPTLAGTVAGAQGAVLQALPPTNPPLTANMVAVNTSASTALVTQQQAFSFQVMQSTNQPVTFTDYNASGAASTQTLCPSVSNDVMTANVSTPLNAANLTSVSNGAGTAPTVNFKLNSVDGQIPKGIGIATVTASLLDGNNITRTAPERALTASTIYNWVSDGTTLTLTAPAKGVVNVSYFTAANNTATAATAILTNIDADILSVTSSGASNPQTVKLKVATLFRRISALTGAAAAGSYYYKVKIEGLPLAFNLSTSVPNGCVAPAANSTTLFRTVQGTLSAQ